MAEFEKYWKEDVREYKLAQQDQKKEREPSLAWCLTKAFIKDYIKAGFLKLIHDINVFVGPIVLHGLIQFLRDPYANMQEGIVLTATVTVSQILHAITYGLYHSVMIQLIDQFFQGRYQIRGQALYSSVSFGVGGAIGSAISGVVWTVYGSNVLFIGAGVLMFVATFLSIILVQRQEEKIPIRSM